MEVAKRLKVRVAVIVVSLLVDVVDLVGWPAAACAGVGADPLAAVAVPVEYPAAYGRPVRRKLLTPAAALPTAHPGPIRLPRGGLPCATRLRSEPDQNPNTSWNHCEEVRFASSGGMNFRRWWYSDVQGWGEVDHFARPSPLVQYHLSQRYPRVPGLGLAAVVDANETTSPPIRAHRRV